MGRIITFRALKSVFLLNSCCSDVENGKTNLQELKEDRLGSRQFPGTAPRPERATTNIFDRFPSTVMDEREQVFFRNSSPALVNPKPESRCDESNILSLSPPYSCPGAHRINPTPNLSSGRRTAAEPAHVHLVDYLTPRQRDHHHMGGGGHVQLDLTMSTGSAEGGEEGQHQYWSESLDDRKRRNIAVPELDLSLELAMSSR